MTPPLRSRTLPQRRNFSSARMESSFHRRSAGIDWDCHENVRKQLRAPTKATFLDRPLFMVNGDTLTITGQVEAMNVYGGFGRVV